MTETLQARVGAELARIRNPRLDNDLLSAGMIRDLEVTDDGPGAPGAEGSGRTGMRERIAALGGRVDVRHASGHPDRSGTAVEVTLPLAETVDDGRQAQEVAER